MGEAIVLVQAETLEKMLLDPAAKACAAARPAPCGEPDALRPMAEAALPRNRGTADSAAGSTRCGAPVRVRARCAPLGVPMSGGRTGTSGMRARAAEAEANARCAVASTDATPRGVVVRLPNTPNYVGPPPEGAS